MCSRHAWATCMGARGRAGIIGVLLRRGCMSRGAQEGGTRVSRGRDAGHAGEPVRCAGGGPRASPRDGLPRAEEPATMTPRGNPGRGATGEPGAGATPGEPSTGAHA